MLEGAVEVVVLLAFVVAEDVDVLVIVEVFTLELLVVVVFEVVVDDLAVEDELVVVPVPVPPLSEPEA